MKLQQCLHLGLYKKKDNQ